MATHSSTLAWKIPWMEKPGRLQSMGSQRVGHGLSDLTFFLSFYLVLKNAKGRISESLLDNLSKVTYDSPP